MRKRVVTAVGEEAVSIKGTRNGLVIIFNPDRDIEEIKSNLKLKMESSRGFFRGAKFTLYTSSSGGDHRYVSELEGICREYGLIPSREVSWLPPAWDPDEASGARRKRTTVVPIRQQAAPDGEQALLVARTLRSGHRIFSRLSIVVMGDVNPGAEVISEGSIYVLGNCKGSVHAGAAGNLMAEVGALKLQPVVLRIGSVTADTPTPANTAAPTAARVHRGKIVFSRL